ncbi:MAG: hypothetical protein ACOYOL_06790 [Chthoniobacterales bacterium]
MSEENVSPPATPATSLRPPDFLLPKVEGNPARGGPGHLRIYLSWGGEVYGPATVMEIMAGLRSSSYEPSALFWFEGRGEWSPLAEFATLAHGLSNRPEAPNPSGVRHEANPESWTTDRDKTRKARKKSGPAPRPEKLRKPPGGGRGGYWVVFFFVLLAIGLTVGILVLISGLI